MWLRDRSRRPTLRSRWDGRLRLDDVAVEEAQEIPLLDPDRRVCPGAELGSLQLPRRDVAAYRVGGDAQPQRSFAYRKQPFTLAIVPICKRIIAGASDGRPRYAPRSGGEGKEPPQGHRPSRGAHPRRVAVVRYGCQQGAGAAIRSLTVPWYVCGGARRVVGEAVASDGSAAARVSPRCTHPSPKVATHRSKGPRRA
jgi:hypothetical protein